MIDETTPPEVPTIPENPGEATTFSAPVSPETPATAPTVTTVAEVPTEVKETFFEKAKIDLEEAIHWLRKELSKI